jgi:hypothetical protein
MNSALSRSGSFKRFRSVRLISGNSENEPEPPDRIWKRLGSDLHPNYLTYIKSSKGEACEGIFSA